METVYLVISCSRYENLKANTVNTKNLSPILHDWWIESPIITFNFKEENLQQVCNDIFRDVQLAHFCGSVFEQSRMVGSSVTGDGGNEGWFVFQVDINMDN